MCDGEREMTSRWSWSLRIGLSPDGPEVCRTVMRMWKGCDGRRMDAVDAFDVMFCCGNWPRRDAVDAFDAILCVV